MTTRHYILLSAAVITAIIYVVNALNLRWALSYLDEFCKEHGGVIVHEENFKPGLLYEVSYSIEETEKEVRGCSGCFAVIKDPRFTGYVSKDYEHGKTVLTRKIGATEEEEKAGNSAKVHWYVYTGLDGPDAECDGDVIQHVYYAKNRIIEYNEYACRTLQADGPKYDYVYFTLDIKTARPESRWLPPLEGGSRTIRRAKDNAIMIEANVFALYGSWAFWWFDTHLLLPVTPSGKGVGGCRMPGSYTISPIGLLEPGWSEFLSKFRGDVKWRA